MRCRIKGYEYKITHLWNLIFLFFIISLANASYNWPAWYLNKYCDNSSCVFGVGKTYEKAIVRGLGDLAHSMSLHENKVMNRDFSNSSIESFSYVNSSISTVNIGNIEIVQSLKDYSDESGYKGSSLSSEHVQSIIKVSYTSGDKYIIIQDFMEESGIFSNGEDLEYTDIQKKGFTVNNLISELKKNDIKILKKDYVYNSENASYPGLFVVCLSY